LKRKKKKEKFKISKSEMQLWLLPGGPSSGSRPAEEKKEAASQEAPEGEGREKSQFPFFSLFSPF